MSSTTISVRSETGDHFRDLRDRTDAFGSDDMVRRLMLAYERGPASEQGLRL